MRVLPDVPALDRALDYSVPDALGDRLRVGTVVRVPLHGRRVRGWVVQDRVTPSTDRALSAVAKVVGLGPDAAVVDLCSWVAWRWGGRLVNVMRSATPDRAVPAPTRQRPGRPSVDRVDPVEAGLADELLDRGAGVHVAQVSPGADPVAWAVAAAARGQALVVVPSLAAAEAVTRGIRRAGGTVARWPAGFAGAVGGHTVVGTRAAVFAPVADLAAVLVWDEHDEGLQNESSPTWHAREVAVERARRAGVPCLLVSPCPSLEARGVAASVSVVPASQRRSGWATLEVVDRRHDDMARTGLWSDPLVRALRDAVESGSRAVCVLNRTGRARLLACSSCGTVAECDLCGSAVHQDETATLRCARCGHERPQVCLVCGGSAMKVLRAGVGTARTHLERLLGVPVAEVSARTTAVPTAESVLIGTEAVLHRCGPAGLVAFVDMDQELLAPRYRAWEEATALVVAASRVVGGRGGPGRVLVQTRLPDHPVLTAAVAADPSRFADEELERRQSLGLPPQGALAVVGGEAAPEWVQRFEEQLREGNEVDPAGPVPTVRGPVGGWWIVQCEDHAVLCDMIAAVQRPTGRLRLRVDPVRLP